MGLTEQDLQKIWNSCYIENFICEMLGILEYVEKVNPLKTIIEIGCGLGGSARVWEAILPPKEGMIIGVDIEEDIVKRFTGKVEKYTTCSSARTGNWELEWKKGPVAKFKSDRQVYVVTGDSSKPETAELVRIVLRDRLADFMFHDGEHWGHGPCWDYHWFQHLLRNQGLLCVGDISNLCEDPMSGCQALYRALPEPKVPKVKGDKQGMGMWVKQEGFVFDAPTVIKKLNVASIPELEMRRAALRAR